LARLVVDPIAAIPPVNTIIVAVVGLLILRGIYEVRRGHVQRHKGLMITATALFGLFLALYVVRMVVHGPTSFATQNPTAPGWAATFYYAFLGTHMVLAVVTIALIPGVFLRAARSHWTEHRRLARKVAPMWLVSIVMGIAVYFLLFQVW
jgi:putative membrane protein